MNKPACANTYLAAVLACLAAYFEVISGISAESPCSVRSSCSACSSLLSRCSRSTCLHRWASGMSSKCERGRSGKWRGAGCGRRRGSGRLRGGTGRGPRAQGGLREILVDVHRRIKGVVRRSGRRNGHILTVGHLAQVDDVLTVKDQHLHLPLHAALALSQQSLDSLCKCNSKA